MTLMTSFACRPQQDSIGDGGHVTRYRLPVAGDAHCREHDPRAQQVRFLTIAVIAFFTFLLARAFRSLLLPLRAVALNVISVGGA